MQKDTIRPELCVSVSVFRNGKILLAERIRGLYAGHYSLPGGRVERGENLQEAALRELREEVKVEASILGFVDHVELIGHNPSGAVDYHAVICVFAAHWLSGEPQSSGEAGDLVWVEPCAILNIATTPGLAEILLKADIVAKTANVINTNE